MNGVRGCRAGAARGRHVVILAALLASTAQVAPSLGASGCGIEGPAAVAAGEPFTLCAPEEEGTAWLWQGAGHRAAARCLNVPGLPPGIYDFTLTIRLEGGGFRRCRHRVAVGLDDEAALCDASPGAGALIRA